jgi:biotin carboxyl carrier protein
VSVRRLVEGLYVVTVDGRERLVRAVADGRAIHVHVEGVTYYVDAADAPRETLGEGPLPPRAGGAHRAPMPGVVTRVFVARGQDVARGDPLFAIEAMKMETVVHAESDGRVSEVHVAAGERVEAGAAGVTVV